MALGFYFTWMCFTLYIFTQTAEGKYVSGTLETDEDWAFITRFCFLSEGASLKFTFEYPVKYGPQDILLYYDDLWTNVYDNKDHTTCQSKRSVLNANLGQIIILTSLSSECYIEHNVSGEDWYKCASERHFQTARERWWFIVASRCEPDDDSLKGMYLKYDLSMKNGEDGDWLHEELSADEFYIAPINIAFFLAYIIICVFCAICAFFLIERQLFHTTYKLYMGAVALWTFHLLLMCISYGMYSTWGEEQIGAKRAARVFSSLSELVFLVMLLLLALGYTVTRGRLSMLLTVFLTVFMCIYTLAFASLIIYEAGVFDEGEVLYIYESAPGYGLIALRLIGWFWFCVSIFLTLKRYPRKGLFYFPLFIFYTIWFWTGPIIIIIAMYAMPKWSREKTVNGVENFVALIGHIFFLVLTRPQAANKNFPFHVRTTQIGIGEDGQYAHQNGAPEGAGSNMDSFSSYAYAPSPSTGPDLTGLFTVSQECSRNNNDSKPLNLSNMSNGAPRRSQGKLPPLRNTPKLPSSEEDRASPSAPPPSYEVSISNPPSYDIFRASSSLDK